MAKSFTDWKADLIRKIVLSEVNSFLHLYIKAQSWNDIIKIMKKSGYEEWNFDNGIISFAMLDDIPISELEAENIYNQTLSINDLNTTVWLLNNANLTIKQTSTSRGKILMFGKAELTASLSDQSMLEVEHLNQSLANIDCAFLILDCRRNSTVKISAFDNSVVKIIASRYARITADMQNNSLLNTIAYEECTINISGNYNNIKIDQIDKSVINQAPI